MDEIYSISLYLLPDFFVFCNFLVGREDDLFLSLCNVILYSTRAILYSVVLCIMLYSILQYCAILYNTVQNCTLLYKI